MTLYTCSGDEHAIECMDGDVMIIRTRRPTAVHSILSNMAPYHQAEFRLLDMSRDDVWDRVRTAHEAYLVTYKGEAVVYWGTTAPAPHMRWVWSFGTPQTRRIVPALARWLQDRWFKRLFENQGVTRIELRMADWHVDRKWLRKVGFVEECLIPGMAANTSDMFVQLAITKDAYALSIRTREEGRAHSGGTSAGQNLH